MPRAKFRLQRPRAGTAPQVPEVPDASSVALVLKHQISQTVAVKYSPRAKSNQAAPSFAPGSWKQRCFGSTPRVGGGMELGGQAREQGRGRLGFHVLPEQVLCRGERRARRPIAIEGQGSLGTTARHARQAHARAHPPRPEADKPGLPAGGQEVATKTAGH